MSAPVLSTGTCLCAASGHRLGGGGDVSGGEDRVRRHEPALDLHREGGGGVLPMDGGGGGHEGGGITDLDVPERWRCWALPPPVW